MKSRVLAYTGFRFVTTWTYLTFWLILFYTKSSVISILHLKPIPNPPDRLNILRLRRIELDLLADLFNMHRHGGDVTDGFHVPDLAEQLLLGEHVVGVLGQEG